MFRRPQQNGRCWEHWARHRRSARDTARVPSGRRTEANSRLPRHENLGLEVVVAGVVLSPLCGRVLLATEAMGDEALRAGTSYRTSVDEKSCEPVSFCFLARRVDSLPLMIVLHLSSNLAATRVGYWTTHVKSEYSQYPLYINRKVFVAPCDQDDGR